MARSRKVSRKKRSAKRKTSRKVAKRCPPGCVKKPMLLTDNGKIILGSTKAAKPKRKTSRKVSRKRRSVKRKVSRKKRSVKRKVSRKRRSVKRKASRKVSRKRRSVKRKSRKRKSAKRKASRKRKSAKRKASRKRKSAKRKASRKRKSAKRKASRKKTRNSPPSGIIKQQNLGVGSVMVGQDGKTMYKVVEITMRGKPVKKWAKMKFKMGLMCSRDDTGECDSGNPKIAAHSMLEKNIKALKEARVKLKESIVVAKKVVRDTKTQKRETNKRLLEAVKANKHNITQRGLTGQKIRLEKFLKRYEKILEGMEDKLVQLNKTIMVMKKRKVKLGEELLGGDNN